MPTTETLRREWILMQSHQKDAWREYTERLKEEFPVKAGDVVMDEEEHDKALYRIERLYVISNGRGEQEYGSVKVEIRKKTKKGWHSKVTVVGGLSQRIVSGRAIKVGYAETAS